WRPVPLLLAMAEPNGPVRHTDFTAMMQAWEAGLAAAGPFDAVYAVLHGAGLTTEDHDPEGTLLAMVRRVVGPDVPVVATFDLHANVSEAMVANLDAFIGYRTNPHMDMRACGAEAAEMVRRLASGLRTHLARVRLPIVSPPTALLTGADAANRPYGELIDLGQARMREPPYGDRVLNVSVMGGFAYADTPFNGLTTVVTATDAAAAAGLGREIAEAGWARRAQFSAAPTPLPEAVSMALGLADPKLPALCFADVADNPGGGGRGNTMWIIEAFHLARVQGAVAGLIHDPALAAEAHAAGVGGRFTARFNRDGGDRFSRPFAAPAMVRALHDGRVVGRRGIFAGNAIDLGPMAALDLGGMIVVVASARVQCADPAFLEALGIDIGQARCVVVKSRGHFRGGFDEFFDHPRIVEVDAPGLTSPVLARFDWQHLPRPVLPLDPATSWTQA
ncbi:MAG TPA: M81 family metallopeptidase, partial [Acetobacteraceae bacterium]|nr:M81 family metallopeptidase [Acetobacteraceae bacterium]